MGEPMRFAGKVDGWYYALTVGVNVMLAWPLASFFADPAKEGAFISAVVCSLRSEERRVGKECRSRWSPYH